MRSSLLCLLPAFTFAQGAGLTVQVEPRWREQPLVLAEPTLQNAAGNRLSITRLTTLLSAAKLQREDGTWIGAGDWQACLDLEKKRMSFTLDGVPAAKYQALRFDVGLDEASDKSDPATRPAGHPLHPDVNSLHWGWKGGYVFFAIEGRWRQKEETDGGFSYHLGGQPCRGTVEVRTELDLRSDLRMALVLDAARIFDAVHKIDITASDSTHSGADGGLARRMADNVMASFSLLNVMPDTTARPGPATVTVTSPGGVTLAIPSHFPQAAWPVDNQLTTEGVALGRRLFNETRLSGNGTQSCSSCHQEKAAFTDPARFSTGAEGKPGARNSMPLANLAWKPAYFWDGRVTRLRDQVLHPIQDPVEMNGNLTDLTKKLTAGATYPAAFTKAFGSPGITPERVGLALEQYLLTIISGSSKLDQALHGGPALTEEEALGFRLFFTESDPARGIRGADCFHCHGGAHFTNNAYMNNGLDTPAALLDQGRAKVTGAKSDSGKFMVPSLRNVARTAPYMHDGRFATLEEVIEHYDTGIQASPTLDPNLAKHLAWKGLGLKPGEKKALVAFLKALSDAPVP